jgi:FkbM family methyltransferase
MRAKKIIKTIVKRFFHKRGYFISSIDGEPFYESLIEKFLINNNELFFIELGANDGRRSDPIYDFVRNNSKIMRGILLEPVKDYFEELKTNYKKYPDIITLNLAVHNSNKEMTIYRADPTKIGWNKLPKWANGIASFNKDHHKKSGIHKEAIIKEKVQCISLNDLIKNYQVAKIDLLQVDTEGYDSEIILNLDFKAIRPKIIHFEHGLHHRIMSKETFLIVADMLHNNGYELWIDSNNATAYQRDALINL